MNEEEKDVFKKAFKYYKSKWPSPDFSEVIDFDEDPTSKVMNITELKLEECNSETIPMGVRSISEWKCYELKPGLIFIKNPFTSKGERYWLAKCIRDYPKRPNKVNLSPNGFSKEIIDDWWSSVQNCKCKVKQRIIKSALRWSTLGYHHNWDTKQYSESEKNDFPEDLAKLTKFFAKTIGFDNYSAEAAIVNYYPIGTTLSGHTDKSESDLEAPLFSLSFGQEAIFLIGGLTKTEKPDALFLKSGDIVVMSKSSRLCYHAVPRVMKSTRCTWNVFETNVHQKIQDSTKAKKQKIMHQKNDVSSKFSEFSINEELWNDCDNHNFWIPFSIYLNDSRININVRQVLKNGQLSL